MKNNFLNSNQPIVSIIIPHYNRWDILGETLDSLIKQTLQSFEVIIVDDGSDSGINAEISSYLNNNNNFSIFYQENQGQSVARHNGALQANGKYLCFLDSDDILAPEYLESCINVLENDSHVVIVYAKAKFFGEVSENWELRPFSWDSFLLDNCIYISAVIRRADYLSVGGFDKNLRSHEDWELFIAILKMTSGSVVCLPESLFFYRKHSKDSLSICNNWTESKISDDFFYIYKKYYEFYKEKGIYLHNLFHSSIPKPMPKKRYLFDKIKNFLGGR